MSWRLWAHPLRLRRRSFKVSLIVFVSYFAVFFGYSTFESSRRDAQAEYLRSQVQYQMARAAGDQTALPPAGATPWAPPDALTFGVYAMCFSSIAWLGVHAIKPWYRGIKNRCWSCCYDLTASEAYKANHLFIRCPECGQKSMTKDPATRPRRSA